MNLDELLKRLSKKVAPKSAYQHGYDCGIHGPNSINCNFGIFSSPENTKEWERGKADAEKSQREKPQP